MIDDPQTQSSYDQADPNSNAVGDAPVGGQDDNQRILARQTPSGTSRGVQQLGGPSLSADSGNKRITVTDSVPRVLMGNQFAFGEGFYVTKPNKDVTQSSNPDDFIFNSNQDVFKIVRSDTVTIPAYSVSSTAGNFTTRASVSEPYLHNLNIVPAFIAYYFDGAEYFNVPFSNTSGSGATAEFLSINVTADSTSFFAESQTTIYGNTSTNNPALPIKFYLLQETAN